MKLRQLLPIVMLGVFSGVDLAAWGDLQNAAPRQGAKPVEKQETKQAPKPVAVKTAAIKAQPVVHAKPILPAAAPQPVPVVTALEALPLVDARAVAPAEAPLRIAKKRAAIINHKKQQHSTQEPEAVHDDVVAEPIRIVDDFAPIVNHKKKSTSTKKKRIAGRSKKGGTHRKKHTVKKNVLDE